MIIMTTFKRIQDTSMSVVDRSLHGFEAGFSQRQEMCIIFLSSTSNVGGKSHLQKSDLSDLYATHMLLHVNILLCLWYCWIGGSNWGGRLA